MNESDIEKKLRSIQPASPSRSLEGRIARELAPQSSPETSGVIATTKPSWLARVLAPMGWAAAGAAAAVLVMLSLDRGGAKPQENVTADTGTISATSENPNDVQREMLDVSDEGILDDGASGPSRIVRYTSIERRQWSEPGGAITLVEVPREDVVLVPVSFQ